MRCLAVRTSCVKRRTAEIGRNRMYRAGSKTQADPRRHRQAMYHSMLSRSVACSSSLMRLQRAGVKRRLPLHLLSSVPVQQLQTISLFSSAPSTFEGGPWHEKYLLLKEYKAEHGDCLVPSRYVVSAEDAGGKGKKLGAWVSEQRRLYKRGKLNINRCTLLDDLGFSWDPLSDKWEENFALMEHYAHREGHANVPQDHVEDGIKLGRWLEWQRRTMRDGTLDESHADRLEALGVSWDPFFDQWEHHFDLLRQFKAREGHCNVAFDHQEESSIPVSLIGGSGGTSSGADAYETNNDDEEFGIVKVKLGHWLGNQRQLAKRDRLDKDREERLTRIGVRW